MASSDQRDNERVPTFLRVRLRFADVDTFIQKYSTNVSMGGVFIQSRSPKPPGTVLKFELALENGESLIKGEGQVTWVREFDANAPGQPFGMGVRFTNLDAKSRSLVDRAVAHRQSRAVTGEATPSTFTPAVPRPAARREPSGPLAPASAVGNADAELDALMREAGLDPAKVARAAARATAAVGQQPAGGALGALLKKAARPAEPPSSPLTPPPSQDDRPEVIAQPPPPVQAVPTPSEPTTAAPGMPLAKAARKSRAARKTPRPVDADGDITIEADPAPAESPADEPLYPPPSAEPPLNDGTPSPDIDELLGGLEMSGPSGLVGADLEIESMGGPQAIAAAGPDYRRPSGHPEITAVGTPPRFEEAPEDEPLVFPNREVSTPPPETTAPFFAPDSILTPSEPGRIDEQPPGAAAHAPAPQSAAERWAAASGPETANLDAELIAALDSVMDHAHVDDAPVAPTPPPAATGAADERGDDRGDKGKKGKGILGRIFRKKG